MTDELEESTSLDDLDNVQRPVGLEAYATWALDSGWDPIPVWGVGPDGTCACVNGTGCKSPGKHPIGKKWQDDDRITKQDAYTWFAASTHPINVGLRTGTRSGFWALDIDPKSGGDESLLTLVSQYGDLPATRIHRTGSGGRHFLFAMPADFEVTNARGRLPRGIDVRGNGGFIVAPGSVTGVGPYRTESADPVAPAPEWLLALIRPQTVDRQIEVVESVPFESLAPGSQASARRYLEAAVNSEIGRLEAMKTEAKSDMVTYRGEPWNETVYQVCCNLLELAQSQWLPFALDDVRKILVDHAPTDRGFTMVDVQGRLASALNKVRGKARDMPLTVTQDSWGILTEGVRHLPKTSEGEVFETWPRNSWDQVGNARRTIFMAAGRLVWVPERQAWSECGTNGVWSSTRNPRDDAAAKWCARAMEAAAVLEASQYSEEPGKRETPSGKEVKDGSEREKFAGFMDKSSTVEMHTAVSTQLRRRAEDWNLEVPESEFDTAPNEFACANGVINLRTGEIRQARLDDYISIASPIAHDPEMKIPHFERFLATSLPDPEVRDYLQKVLGYSMTNSTAEQKMFIHFGERTANGKSVLMNILTMILGEHLSPASEKTIIKQRSQASQRIGQDMVDLRGHRFLVLNETDEGGILDSAAVKSMTSGDMRADRPHAKANLKYRITGKIHLVTNHLPHITPDPAMRRRITVIPWKESFLGREDPLLEDKLRSELPGILAWLVTGARRWYADFESSGRTGLVEPASCAAELDDYFAEEDEVASWLKEQAMALDVESEPQGWTPVKDLYSDYTSWRFSSALQGQALSATQFGRRLSAKGFNAKTVRLGDKTPKMRPLRLNSSLLSDPGLTS